MQDVLLALRVHQPPKLFAEWSGIPGGAGLFVGTFSRFGGIGIQPLELILLDRLGGLVQLVHQALLLAALGHILAGRGDSFGQADRLAVHEQGRLAGGTGGGLHHPFGGVLVQEGEEEEQEADKDIQPERRHLGSALAGIEFHGQPARPEKQRHHVAEEFRIEVEKILQRLEKRVTEGAVDVEVVLAAVMAEGALQRRAAILAVFVSVVMMGRRFDDLRPGGIGRKCLSQ